ncbi:MAG TPA: SDR family oxidoreductase, partial [Phototrophicaceae bacterium]|nr:SDR family oxidoreductase [Phototrophicaceae bacterium]
EQVACITGVAGGIGSATARVFAEAGWQVVGVDRRSTPNLPGVHRFICADISLEQDSQSIFDIIKQEYGRLDTLVNNAAVQVAKPLIETTPEEWDMVMGANLRAVYLAIQRAYPLLKLAGKASIVNVSSVHAIQTSANIAAYAASKGALLALTRALSIEMAPDDIRVNAILPGAVDTHMLRAGLGRGHVTGDSIEDRLNALGAKHVIGRIGQPEEIAQAILFMADNHRASFVTGQALVVDGGATARLSTE